MEQSNHSDNLEEGGDEEEVGEKQGEQHGGDIPTLLPLAEGDLRKKTILLVREYDDIVSDQATAEDEEGNEKRECLAEFLAEAKHLLF